jgi:hypothetical protein
MFHSEVHLPQPARVAVFFGLSVSTQVMGSPRARGVGSANGGNDGFSFTDNPSAVVLAHARTPFDLDVELYARINAFTCAEVPPASPSPL